MPMPCPTSPPAGAGVCWRMLLWDTSNVPKVILQQRRVTGSLGVGDTPLQDINSTQCPKKREKNKFPSSTQHMRWGCCLVWWHLEVLETGTAQLEVPTAGELGSRGKAGCFSGEFV